MQLIVVKVLNLSVKSASKSLVAECNTLRKANGSLEKWLHHNTEEDDNGAFKSLDLIQRFKIAIDVAHAVEYLHRGTDSVFVHGDLKPSSILFDHDMVAHVGDFGLSKIVSTILPTFESSSLGIKGSLGYIPPGLEGSMLLLRGYA